MLGIIVAAAIAAPAADGAGRLALARFEGAARPSATLGVPALALAGAPDLRAARDEGGGAGAKRGAGVDPAIALVLGIIPGFGIGHVVAGSARWPIWLVADIVIAVVFWAGDAPGGLALLVLVERIFEGLDAYGEARGRSVFGAQAPAGPPPGLAVAALPGAEPRLSSAAGPPGLRF
jgi:hypothetical protein